MTNAYSDGDKLLRVGAHYLLHHTGLDQVQSDLLDIRGQVFLGLLPLPKIILH